jgi:hypothetical protein
MLRLRANRAPFAMQQPQTMSYYITRLLRATPMALLILAGIVTAAIGETRGCKSRL